MNISELSLRRPVLAVVMNVVIVIFGLIGYSYLGVRDYPVLDPPNINVRTSYAGANAEIIETQITEPLEAAVNGISGIKNISSTSSQGSSSINVEFELGTDLEAATNDVRDKVSQAVRSLPNDLDAPPVVSKADNTSDPVLNLLVQSDKRSPLELTEFSNNYLVEKLQTVPGVSSVGIWGEKRYAMRIWFDPVRMNAYSVTPMDVRNAIQRQNVELPSGKISGDGTEMTVRTFGKLNTEEEFNNLIIKNENGANVKIKDIGYAILGPENEESILKESGVPMNSVAVIPQPGTNYIEISDEVQKRLAEIMPEIPKDISVQLQNDQTKNIRKSILEVKETLLISFFLVVLIIYFFFRDWLIAFRPLVDIPVSLIGAFFIMYMFGFTMNILTLLAIVLATGLVVDDGIVVTENIFKKIEQGMDKNRAALEGSKEIYFAVIATSITLAVVFLPIIFLQGFVGRLFREFGIVVAAAVLISSFVSLTLTPVLTVYLSRKDQKHSKFYTLTEPFFRAFENGYHRLLKGFMRVRWMAFVITAACLGIIYFMGKNLQSELAPMEDKSAFRLSVSAPEGTSYDAMDKYIDSLVQFIMDSVPERTYVVSRTASGWTGAANTGFIRVTLVDPDERVRTQKQVVEYVNRAMRKYNRGRAFAIEDQTIQVSRRSGQPVSFVLQNSDAEKLRTYLPRMLSALENSNVLTNADADLKFNKPELRITIDRLKASEMGVSISDISQTLQMALSNQRIGYFMLNGKQYQVMGQVERADRDDPADLKNIYVRNTAGSPIPLSNLIQVSEDVTPPTLYHYNRYRSATISAGVAPGKTIGDGIAEIRAVADTVLDPTFRTTLSGSSRDFEESSGNTYLALILALVLIYLVLAAQFESFIDPFIIMFTVPLAIAGAILSLTIFGQTMNIFSQIGMIMLIGLVTKNGILIVEFANQKQKAGEPKMDAIVEGSVARFRPILMTSLAMGLGALPIALSFGEAATSRIPLGIVIVGGILFSLILTLFVVPAIYSYFSRKKKPNYYEKLDEEKERTELKTIKETDVAFQ